MYTYWLCNSNELKRYGVDPILRKIVDELKHLSTMGFSGDFPVVGARQIFVCLGQVACDNLELNSIFGFIECFSVDYFCTMCYAIIWVYVQYSACKKGKVFPYSLPSVGPGADPGVQAVSPQVM